MFFNAPSLSGAGLALFVAAVHFVLDSGIGLVAFFLAFACFAVVAKVGCYVVGPTVGDFIALIVHSLGDKRRGIGGTSISGGRLEFLHHGLEKILMSVVVRAALA